MKSKVLFSTEITPENMIRMYEALGVKPAGRVACKLHSGEMGNQNYLRPEFMRPIVEHVKGTVVECNTAYGGSREKTEDHWATIKAHGWSHYFDVDLMDAQGDDLILPVPGGRVLRQNYVGRHLENYDFLLVLSHFKGHPMGGFGGALKQLSIGCASSRGKAWIHSCGRSLDTKECWALPLTQDRFLEAMADAASTVAKAFAGRSAYISVLKNLSVDCDCCEVAEDPCMRDIGILASLDPVAIDQAGIDLVNAQTDDPGQAHFLERVNSRHGVHTIEAAAELGFGSREYELIRL